MSVMRGDDGADLQRRAQASKVATRLLQQPLRTLGVGVTVIVLGTTALFGGLADADAGVPRVSGLRVGETVRAEPYEITLRKVLWVDELPNVYPTEKGNRWLAITATVRNTHTESLFGAVELGDSLALTGVDGLVKEPEKGTDRVESTYRKVLADTSDLTPVSPGVPYEMVYLFEQQASATPPTEVTVQVVRHTWRENSLDQSMGWFDPAVIAQATLPMVESPQQVEEKQAAAEKAGDRKAKKKGSGGGTADEKAGDAGGTDDAGDTEDAAGTGTGGDA
jgi:hypothetical protein